MSKANWSKGFLSAIQESVSIFGLEQTAKNFNLTTDSVNRYLREARKKGIKSSNKDGVLKKLLDKYSKKELEAIANGGKIAPGCENVPQINFEGQRIRVGAITDTHIGHKRCNPDYIYAAFEEFRKEKVDFITHSGDVLEGMSVRAGHVYELSHIGYEDQKATAVKIFSQWTDTPIYAISGNHDRWYIKAVGANAVKDIESEVKNFMFIGHDEGDISLKGQSILKLWHGEDGSSYALSYRAQKIIESLTGGEKPGAILAGHVHKFVDIFERNIHFTSVGSIERQTKWMRGKRISAHTGFAIIDYWVNHGIVKKTLTWYPFY